MNIRQKLRTSSVLAAAFSIFTVIGTAQAGDLLGDKVGGLVGGLAGGVAGTAHSLTGGVTGGVANAVSGATSTPGSITGTGHNYGTNSYGHSLGSFHGGAKVVVTAKIKSELLKAKAGVYVLGKHGQLVRISAKLALDNILHAKARVYVLSHGNLIRVKTKVALLGIKAKAKVYVLDDGNLIKAKAIIALGGKKGLKAKVGAKAGIVGVNVRIGLSLGGGKHKPGGGGNNGGNNGGGPNVGGSLGTAVAGLSPGEHRQLMRKCPSVLMSPANYTSDTVRVCRVIAQLSGL